MEKDLHQTAMVFRTYKSGEVIAVFPYEIEDTRGNVMSYTHVGQHGGADYNGVISDTKQSTIEEYTPLFKELESFGYNIKVIQKRNSIKYHLARKNMLFKILQMSV